MFYRSTLHFSKFHFSLKIKCPKPLYTYCILHIDINIYLEFPTENHPMIKR